MSPEWETTREKLQRSMKISGKKKLEWLYQMNRLAVLHLPAKTRKIRLKLMRSKGVFK